MTDAEKVSDWVRYSESPGMVRWHPYDAAYRNDGERVFLQLCKQTGIKTLTDFVKLLAP